MRKIFLTLGIISFWFSVANAQNFSVKGKVSADNKPVEAATISLLKADSTKVRQEFSGKDGQFLVGDLNAGSYLLSIQSVGYKTYYSPVITLNEKNPQTDLPSINLEATAKLDDVVVTAQKQYIEQKIDKTVV